jgi:two-component system, chemotaxis family, CheB/CheR fusion protein
VPTATEQLEDVIEKIRRARNFDFRNYKRATLRRRIERRISERGCRGMADYLELLDRSPEEYDALLSSLLIKVTAFFRDKEMWDLLAKKVLPEIVARKSPGDEIRIWSAGCATGEEVYSAAILLSELLGPKVQNVQIKVFGTDVDESAIAHARHGVYTSHSIEELSRERISKFFARVPGGYAVSKDLRRLVVFGVNNLVSDAPISRIDLLLCRNVFIYLDAALQKRVLSRFHYALRQAGVLVLGRSELIPFAAKIFDSLDLRLRVYRRGSRAAAVNDENLLGQLEQEDIARAVRQSREDLGGPGLGGPDLDAARDILQALPLPIIGTSLDGTVQLWNGAAARLWRRPESEVRGKKLTALALPGIPGHLLVEKTALVRDGKAERQIAEAIIPRPEGPLDARIEVTASNSNPTGMTGLVYTVVDTSALRSSESELRHAREERQRGVEDLENANQELQSSNEELETTNEELQSANEELQTTNEELQSINEELETTNEELQSTNSELDATNRELAQRTDELNVLGYYQRTIIRSLSAAVVVVDPQGRITTWNLAAERLLGLAESEALGQLVWTLRVPILNKGLVKKIRRNLGKGLATREEDLPYAGPGGVRGHSLVSAVPLVDADRKLGAVIIVEDTTRAVALAEERLREEAPRPLRDAASQKGR